IVKQDSQLIEGALAHYAPIAIDRSNPRAKHGKTIRPIILGLWRTDWQCVLEQGRGRRLKACLRRSRRIRACPGANVGDLPFPRRRYIPAWKVDAYLGRQR